MTSMVGWCGMRLLRVCIAMTVCPAAVLSSAVKPLRASNPNTVFAAAGDLIGASTFESFVQDDEPTIAALNEAGLDVSSVGNHEFDQGYEDLVGRVQGLADWEYIGANVDGAGRVVMTCAETWTKTVRRCGDRVRRRGHRGRFRLWCRRPASRV